MTCVLFNFLKILIYLPPPSHPQSDTPPAATYPASTRSTRLKSIERRSGAQSSLVSCVRTGLGRAIASTYEGLRAAPEEVSARMPACLRGCVRARVCACARACVRACARGWVGGRGCVPVRVGGLGLLFSDSYEFNVDFQPRSPLSNRHPQTVAAGTPPSRTRKGGRRSWLRGPSRSSTTRTPPS